MSPLLGRRPSLCVIYKEGLCPSSKNINRLMNAPLNIKLLLLLIGSITMLNFLKLLKLDYKLHWLKLEFILMYLFNSEKRTDNHLRLYKAVKFLQLVFNLYNFAIKIQIWLGLFDS
jgi:hypothetical protein